MTVRKRGKKTVIGADRQEMRQFSIILQKYVKVSWLTVQIKSHYNKYCGKQKLRLLHLRASANALRTLGEFFFSYY